jgi:hypothetical protein
MASIESQLGGEAVFDWRPEGLVCRLLVPMTQQAQALADDDSLFLEPRKHVSNGSELVVRF